MTSVNPQIKEGGRVVDILVAGTCAVWILITGIGYALHCMAWRMNWTGILDPGRSSTRQHLRDGLKEAFILYDIKH